MAKYRIKSLNYMSTGEGRRFVNMDTELDCAQDFVHLLALEPNVGKADPLSADVLLEQGAGEFRDTEYIQTGSREDPSALSREGFPAGVILNEQQRWYDEFDQTAKPYIRLILSSDSEEYRKQLIELYLRHRKDEHVFVVERGQQNGNKNALEQAEAIYDIDDLVVKSKNRISNGRLPDFDSTHPRTEDVCLPEISSIGFCQSGKQTYLLTGKTADSTGILSSSLNAGLERDGSFVIANGRLKTYLYQTYSGISGVASAMTPDRYFLPSEDLSVEYNYIVECPTGSGPDATNYDSGNIYGQILHAKNAYDSVYGMDVPSVSAIRNCRDYDGIGQCGGKMYLKYRDCVDYSGGVASSGDSDGKAYQRIEFFDKVSYRTTARHKSFFFSIKVADVDLESRAASPGSDEARLNDLRLRVRRDVRSAITEIARNVCPVQTQFIGVAYSGEDVQ